MDESNGTSIRLEGAEEEGINWEGEEGRRAKKPRAGHIHVKATNAIIFFILMIIMN